MIRDIGMNNQSYSGQESKLHSNTEQQFGQQKGKAYA